MLIPYLKTQNFRRYYLDVIPKTLIDVIRATSRKSQFKKFERNDGCVVLQFEDAGFSFGPIGNEMNLAKMKLRMMKKVRLGCLKTINNSDTLYKCRLCVCNKDCRFRLRNLAKPLSSLQCPDFIFS